MIKRINSHDLTPIIGGGKIDNRPIRGGDLIPHVYCNIFAVGRKKSGKSTAVTYIIRKCALPRFTTIIVFSATASTDPTWIATFKELDKMGVAHIHFTSLIDEETRANHLQDWFAWFKSEHPDEEDEKAPKPKSNQIGRGAIPLETQVKVRKDGRPKEQAPETIFVFDDFSLELRDKFVAKMVREHRHFFCKVIVSSQFLMDLRGMGSRGQIDIWLLWAKIDEDVLKQIARTIGMRADLLLRLYHLATHKPHNFLYLDQANKDVRINFTHQINKNVVE